MRVYINYPDISDYEGDPFEKVMSSYRSVLMTKVKYQLLYCFRSIEDELNACDGIIIINDGGKFDLKEFPESLVDKMKLLFEQGQQLGYFE